MHYTKSLDKINRDKREGLLQKLYRLRGEASYSTIQVFVENEMDIIKNKMLDASGDDLIKLQGEAIAYRNLSNLLRNPRGPKKVTS